MRKLLRVLLDENVDRHIRTLLDEDFVVRTVPDMGWAGLQNGGLLRAAALDFDVFVTMDRNLPYQQNLKSLDLAVVVVRSRSNAFADVEAILQDLNRAIRVAKSGAATFVGLSR